MHFHVRRLLVGNYSKNTSTFKEKSSARRTPNTTFLSNSEYAH